jgi:hypothetical protein
MDRDLQRPRAGELHRGRHILLVRRLRNDLWIAFRLQLVPKIAERRRLETGLGGAQHRSFETELGFERNGIELPCRGRTWGAAQEMEPPPVRPALNSALREKACLILLPLIERDTVAIATEPSIQ